MNVTMVNINDDDLSWFYYRLEERGQYMPSTKTPTHCRVIRDLQFRGHAVYGVRVVSTSHSQIVRYLQFTGHDE